MNCDISLSDSVASPYRSKQNKIATRSVKFIAKLQQDLKKINFKIVTRTAKINCKIVTRSVEFIVS